MNIQFQKNGLEFIKVLSEDNRYTARKYIGLISLYSFKA